MQTETKPAPSLSKPALLKFIRIRNKSGFSSNLQFAIDATEAGVDVDLLGDAMKADDGGYEWQTPHGLLVERPNGQLELVA
jgi:hypothetical protein